jgi:hypothetical protein
VGGSTDQLAARVVHVPTNQLAQPSSWGSGVKECLTVAPGGDLIPFFQGLVCEPLQGLPCFVAVTTRRYAHTHRVSANPS